MNDYFASVFTKEISDTLPTLPKIVYPTISDISVTYNGVVNLLKILRSIKHMALIKFPIAFSRNVQLRLLIPWYYYSRPPSSRARFLLTALVSPIFKKGDRSLPSNYRPVSLVCVCCKILEHIIYSEIMKHLNSHKILSDAQHGFRQNHSCESQLLLTVNDFAKGLDDGKQTDAVSLDFSKAFNKVSHKYLFIKLSYYGI